MKSRSDLAPIAHHRVPRLAKASPDAATERAIPPRELAERIQAAWRACGYVIHVELRPNPVLGPYVRSDLVAGLPRDVWERAWGEWHASAWIAR